MLPQTVTICQITNSALYMAHTENVGLLWSHCILTCYNEIKKGNVIQVLVG